MKKTGIFLAHLGYWLLFALLLLTLFFFAVYIPAHTQHNIFQTTTLFSWLKLMTGFAIIPSLLSFYIAYTYLFTRFLGRKAFFSFIITSWISALFAALVGAAIASLPFLFGAHFLFGDGYSSAISILFIMTIIAWINGMIGAVLKGSLTWYHDIRLKEELSRKTTEAELALVKSQIDPHFLFNTLNNIDVLITKDAQTASTYLNKLSSIMRFLLYEAKDKEIDLDRELEYLQQYIDLQRIRTSNIGYVVFQVEGQSTGKTIAPMIMLPFIENAFKHTEARKTSCQIQINLKITEKELLFTCDNTLIQEKQDSKNGGLGNLLVRKRLELLYPKTHTLTMAEDGEFYRVKLALRL